MSNQGLTSLFPMENIAVMGIWELLPHLNKIRARLKETVEAALVFQPHVVVTIDSKGFSFRLLRQLRARYVQQRLASAVHIHYVAPSFWAWKGGEARLRGLTPFVDHVLCILPFEADTCRSNGLGATFVGHPVVEDFMQFNTGKHILSTTWKEQGFCEGFRRKYGISSGATIISVLPGSRLQEVNRMLPIFSKTMDLMKDSFSDLTTIIHVAPNQLVENYINGVINEWPVPIRLIPGGSLHQKYSAFGASRVALCTSGTVAVELQLAQLPCLITYRAHLLTEWFIRYKAKIPYMSLPNILLNSGIIPEALFDSCTPAKLSSLLCDLIHNEDLRDEQIGAAEKIIGLLKPSKPDNSGLDSEFMFSDNTPSMAAASTILYTVISR